MNSRERVLATLRHERPDRVALDGWFRPEIISQLKTRLGTEDWREALGLDWGGGGGCRVRWPEWEKRDDLAAKEGVWPGAGGRYLWSDERTFADVWGVVHRIGEDGKYNEWLSGPLVGVDAESAEARELIENIIPAHALEPIAATAKRIQEHKAKGGATTAGIPLPFKIAWMLRGMENLLCDFLLNPEFVHRLFDRLYAFYTEVARRSAAAGVDIITVVGDIASQDRLLFSHDIFAEYIKPRLRKLVETARAASPLDHLYFFYHCDGDMSAVLPDFVEDLEFDIINPIQPECMDCCEVKQRYGNRITLHGTMSVVDLLPRGPVERIRQTVRERIDRLAYNGGFVLSSANVITYDTPVEHVLAMYEEARNYTSDQWPKG